MNVPGLLLKPPIGPPRAAEPTAKDEAIKRAFAEIFAREVTSHLPFHGTTESFSEFAATALADTLASSDLFAHTGQARSTPAGSPGPAAARRALATIDHVTSKFGLREDPIDGGKRRHSGLDLGAPTGTPVRAALEGTVTSAREAGGYGNLVVVRHANGVETRYAHLSSIAVEPGQVLDAGAVLGAVGATGRATGPHLHFEVRQNGIAEDPEPWLAAEAKVKPLANR